MTECECKDNAIECCEYCKKMGDEIINEVYMLLFGEEPEERVIPWY